MGAVAARQVLADQVRAAQLADQRPPGPQRDAGQARRPGDRDVGAGMDRQQPEEPGGRGRECLVGPGEDGTQAGLRVVAVEAVQAPGRLGQLGGDLRRWRPRQARRAGGHHGQRERQPPAAGDDGVDRGRVRCDAAGAERPEERRAGLVEARQADRQRVGAGRGQQAAEPAAAGDDHQTVGAARQQVPDLLGVPAVVEHDQQAPAGKAAAVHARLGVQLGGNALLRHPERAEEAAQRLGRAHRRLPPVVSAQVDIQLPVRVAGGELVGEVDGEGGLADPGHAVDREHRRPARARDRRAGLGDEVVPAAEEGQVRRQLRGPGE